MVWIWVLLQPAAALAQASAGGTEKPNHRFTLLRQDNPRIALAAADVEVSIRLSNDGSAAWSDEELYRVSYWWLTSDGTPAPDVASSRRSFLPRTIGPGEVLELVANLETPAAPGRYRLRWDVVQEGVGWFSAAAPALPPTTAVVVVPSFASLMLFAPVVAVFLVVLGAWIRRSRGGRTARVSVPLPDFVRRNRGWWLVLIGALSLTTALVIQGDRDKPTVFGDEALYTYKARNFAKYASYFAPGGRPDSLHLSAPFYSFLLAPIFLVVPDSDEAFPWILLLNALLHASMIYPAWKIAEAEFPSQRWLVAGAIAFWTIPASSSLSIMSEALFVPLFLWTGYLYLRALKRPSMATFAIVGGATSVLLLTRFSGVAMLGVFAVVCAVTIDGDSLRLTRWRPLLERLPMLLLPAACWGAFRWARGQHESEALHSLVNYAAKSVLALDGRLSGLDFVRVWVGELAYLNLATFNLLTLLVVVTVTSMVHAGPWRWRPVAPNRSGLLPLKGFFLLASVAMLTTATVYMFTHLQTGKPRYAMYGRYADMVVPIVVIYALGGLSPRLRPRWSWRWCLGAIGGLMLTAGFFWSIPDVGDTRVINMGAAWYRQLQHVRGMSWWMVAVPGACLILALVASVGRRAWVLALAAVLALVNVQNTRLVEASHRFYAEKDSALWRQLEDVRTHGGRVFYRELLDVPQISSRAQYLLYDRVVKHVQGRPVDFDRDFFVTKYGLMSAREYFELKRP